MQALISLLMQLLGGSGSGSSSGGSSTQTLINLLLQMLMGGGGSGGSGSSSAVQSLISQLLALLTGGSGSSSSGGVQSLINQLLSLLGGGSGSSSSGSSGTTTSTSTSTSTGSSSGTSSSSGGQISTAPYPYTQDFSSSQPANVYAGGSYTAQGQGWGLAQATTSQGQTVNLAAIGGQTGYPADCSTGNNAQNPEVLMFGAFDFSQVSPQDQPTAAFQAVYQTQGSDGGIFFVYDLNTQRTDTPNPIAGTYDLPLQSGTGGVLAGQNQQVMAFDLSAYAGTTDQYVVGILFQSSGQAGQMTPGYFAFTDVFVGPHATFAAATGGGSQPQPNP